MDEERLKFFNKKNAIIIFEKKLCLNHIAMVYAINSSRLEEKK